MRERDDDIIEFDFFDDEPETEQATQRRPALRPRSGGRREGGAPPRRPTFRGPEGVTPLLRLVLLVALAIFVVIVLVFWIQSCRSESRTNAYRDYMQDVNAVATASRAIGNDLNDQLTTPGINRQDLIRAIEGLTGRQEQVVGNAEEIDPPGPLRDEQDAVVEALQFRVSGLTGLGAALRDPPEEAGRAGIVLSAQAERFVASDVIWDDLFAEPSRAELEAQGISGVAVPDSNFVITADLASQRSMVALYTRLQGAAEGGTPTGLHGTGIVSTVVLPSGEELSRDSENIVEATGDLAFRVTIQNSGDSQEVGIKVTLTIPKLPQPITQTKTIRLINSGESRTVTFEDLSQPPFDGTVQLKIDVEPVPGEANTTNNTEEYPVLFSIL